MEATTFTALAERAGRWWTVRIPQIDGLAVQVRSLDQAEMMARQRIAELLHLAPESIRVEVRTGSSILPAVTQALQARQAALHAAETAVRATQQAIAELLAEGATYQEAAAVLGLSPEEVAQFAAADPRGGGGGARSAPEAERPAGPGGLPQRVPSSGPMAIQR
jgi:hypothetical protein